MSNHHHHHLEAHAHDAFCTVLGKGRGIQFRECELAAEEQRLKTVRERILREFRQPLDLRVP